MKLYLHSPNTLPWRGAQRRQKAQRQLYLYFHIYLTSVKTLVIKAREPAAKFQQKQSICLSRLVLLEPEWVDTAIRRIRHFQDALSPGPQGIPSRNIKKMGRYYEKCFIFIRYILSHLIHHADGVLS